MHFLTRQWDYSRLGAHVVEDGVGFALLSPAATHAELLIYEDASCSNPSDVITLDPDEHHLHGVWHVHVAGVAAGAHYTWRLDGPRNATTGGCRFDPGVELLDPYAREVSVVLWDRTRAIRGTTAAHRSMRAVVVGDDDYDWEGDMPLERAPEEAVVYEMHPRGFTRHSSAGVERPGTFAGLIEKIPYLRELGITDVELLPVFAFDEQDVPPGVAARGLGNYWGYSPHSFFALHPAYGATPATVRREFRDLVKALHAAGIGVILDVVLNHTAEGGAGGPAINFKGMSNEFFYHLEPGNRGKYRDYTGCGNTINCNHPHVMRLLLDCLEYWVRDMHVDGFRFDLASVMTRRENGEADALAPLPWAIELSPVLSRTRLIAEAWDAAGLYQVGSFPGRRWAEWNGRYRDAVRRFVRGDKGLVGEVAVRVSASSDLYAHSGRPPSTSINFVTCHDGFTLNDLVSYGRKHNLDNGEHNRDGSDSDWSANHGVEGDSGDRVVRTLRERQAKNFVAILMLSQGVPMLLAGDEVLRTQRGNNNAYCQDNAIGWFDWTLVERNAPMLRFVREMIRLRRRHPNLLRRHFLTGERVDGSAFRDISWHGRKLGRPCWDDPETQILAFTLTAVSPGEEHLHVIMNMAARGTRAVLPAMPGRHWFRAVDTSRPAPTDIMTPGDQRRLFLSSCWVHPHSVVVLESR